jgi:hypothetical protein
MSGGSMSNGQVSNGQMSNGQMSSGSMSNGSMTGGSHMTTPKAKKKKPAGSMSSGQAPADASGQPH